MLDIPSAGRPAAPPRLAPPQPLTSGKTLDRRLGDLVRILSAPANKTTDTPAERAHMAVTQTLIEVTAWIGELLEGDEDRLRQEADKTYGLQAGAPAMIEFPGRGRIRLLRRAGPKGSVEMHSRILLALQRELEEFALRENRRLEGRATEADDDPRRWT